MITNLELSIILLNVFVFSLFFFSLNGLQLLVYSEVAWVLLYCAFSITSKLFDTTLIAAAVLPILIFASIDCSLWVLFLVFIIKKNSQAFYLTERYTTKFILRSGRQLLTNRHIK